jgi:hypothetical protein
MLGGIKDRSFKMRFNALSEFTFTAFRFIDGVATDYYDSLDYRRIINIPGVANFMITQMEISDDGINQTKKITCQSRECELGFKKLSLFKTDGSIQFYSKFNNPESTLMGQILNYIPGWSMGDVDPDVSLLFRGFDVTDITIYGFLTNEVSQTYQCIFNFDSINKIINVYSTATATHNTDAFFSYQNLVQQVNIKEITDELVTALNVYGGGGLDIARVNPLGNNTIYNFDYYKNTQWMSPQLISDLNAWESLMNGPAQTDYANTLTQITVLQTNLISACAVEVTLQGELDALTEVLTVQIQQGDIDIAPQNALVKAKQSEVDNQKTTVAVISGQIDLKNQHLAYLNGQLSLERNFLGTFGELSNFIIGSTYTNPNFIQTDQTSAVDAQDYSQQLFDQAKLVLAKVAEPRYTFEVNSANFVFLKEYQTLISQLDLGSVVTVEFDDGGIFSSPSRFAFPVLLGIDYDYDNPTNFKLIFSNRLRLDDSAFQFSDLLNQSINSGLTTSFNSEMWSSWQNYHKDSVSTFINSALDASKNAVLGAKNQQFLIDGNGLRGRYLDPDTGKFAPEQLWMINNMLVFTGNNWDTASLALGKITSPTGGSAFGLVADVLVGRLVAANDLWIENERNSFRVTGSGVFIENAFMNITATNSQILLDPDTGISISKRDSNGYYTDRKFWTDTDGNVRFSGSLVAASGQFDGSITATSGRIGMWNIDQFGLFDDAGNNYIYGDGRIRLGKLEIDGSNARFYGTFYADNLNDGDTFTGDQLSDINADTITAGTITGIDIYGSTISWPGVTMYSPFPGTSDIRVDGQFSVYAGSSYLALTPKFAILSGTEYTSIGNITNMGSLSIFASKISVVDADYNSGTGVSGTFVI